MTKKKQLFYYRFFSVITLLICNIYLVNSQEKIDSTNFSLNNYLADIEEANNYVRYTKNSLKNDLTFKNNQIEWHQFGILVDSVINQINSEKENIIRFQEIIDLKKKIKFWLRKTKQLSALSKSTENELIKDIDEAKNFTILLKKYEQYKALQYEDRINLDNSLSKLKQLQKVIDNKNLKVARLSANLIKQERRLMLINENIDQNLINLNDYLTSKKDSLAKQNNKPFYNQNLEVTTFKNVVSDFFKKKTQIIYLFLYLIISYIIIHNSKKNILNLQSYYKSIHQYEFYNSITSFYLLPSLIIGAFLFYLLNFDVSNLLNKLLQTFIVCSYFIMMIYIKSLRKYFLATILLLLINLIAVTIKFQLITNSLNIYLLLTQTILSTGLILNLIFTNTNNKNIKRFIIILNILLIVIFAIGFSSSNKIYFVSLLDFISNISSKTYIFIVCGSIFTVISFSFIHSPKLIKASFMVDKFSKIYLKYKIFMNLVFIVILFSYFLSIIGYKTLFIQGVNNLWNFEITLGKTDFHISTFLSFWITLFLGIIFLTFIKNIFSEFISNKATFISKNLTLVNLSLNVGIYFWSIIFAFYISGFNLESLTFIISALSVGIGFGLQNLVSNFISGIILAIEKPIRKDDLIELENNTFGTVENIGVRASLIRTWDGAEITVPNSNLISNQVTNWTLSDKNRRCKLLVGVAYSSDLKLVKSVIEESINKCHNVLSEPTPNVYCTNFLDSSIEFTSILWTNESVIELKSELSIIIVNEFRKNNIVIPFPQRDINITEIKKKT